MLTSTQQFAARFETLTALVRAVAPIHDANAKAHCIRTIVTPTFAGAFALPDYTENHDMPKHPYETYGSTKTPKRGVARRIAPSHYLVYGHRGAQYLVKRVYINDGNGPAKHYWQTTKVLSQIPFVESTVIDLSDTKKAALAQFRGERFGEDL